MGTAADVIIGVGEILGAPAGSTLPTTPTDPIDAAFVDFGFISSDGVTESQGDQTTDIKAWDGSTVRTVQTEHTVTFKFTFLETNPETLALFYNNYDAGVVHVKAGLADRQCFVIDMKDGDAVIRIAIPDGQVSTRDDIVYKNDTAVEYGLTITCYPDETGVKAYKFVVDQDAS